MIKKYIDVEIKKVDTEEGSFEVVASSGKVDRMGDSIDPKGWFLKNYKKNPVILWSHSTGGMFGSTAIPPVAKAEKVWVDNDKELKIKGKWADTPFAQELRTLVEGGFLNAVSVGFLPLVEDIKGMIEIDEKMYRRVTDDEIEKGIYDNEYGEKFTKQELLETSWVSVPALPQALVSARKMNLSLVTKALEDRMKDKELETEKIVDEKKSVEDINIKDGRVISAKNRKLINNCLNQMGSAIDALKELLEATEPADKADEPKKSITSSVVFKGRSGGKAEKRINPELRLMRLADKAVDDALRNLKKTKQRKVEIRYLKIAAKATDAANINAKAKK